MVLEDVIGILLEEGGEAFIGAGELRWEEGWLVFEPNPTAADSYDVTSWPVADIAAVRFQQKGRRSRKVDVLTPDDLMEKEDRPRVERVTLRDGTVYDLDVAGPGVRPDVSGLALVLPLKGERLRVPVGEIQTILVHHPSTLAWLGSPWTWAVGAAAAGLVAIIVALDGSENDRVR
jgi:hypothetical protein